MRLTVAHLHPARLAAATLLVAAAGTLLPAPPAMAATCSSGTGVSVVVDASGLGGGVVTSCVADGGGDAAGALFEVHHDLTRASQFPGAVCRVDGAPADAECRNMPPSDAYWGLFWSDGSGGWVYSSQGVDSLDIPDGGSVAFAWQDGGDQDPPGVAPPQHDEDPSPSPTPTGGGGGGGGSGSGGSGGSDGGAGPTGGGSSAVPSVTPSATPTGAATPGEGDESTDGKPGKTKPSVGEDKGKKNDKDEQGRGEAEDGDDLTEPAEPASATTDAVLTTDLPTGGGDDGLPTWVAPVGIAGLFGIAGVVALLRRRTMP
ncbi:MAG: hypothetical protein ACXWXO_19930 [Nocardioides sp.]